MYALRHIRTGAAMVAVAITWPMTFGVRAHAEGGTTVVLDNYLRRCDFSRVGVDPKVGSPMLATGSAVIRTSGSRAVAEVHLYDEPGPGTHFDVGLIQMPRPSSSTCGPGDPGTAFSGMDIDAAGNGTTTVQDTIRPGTTGVWVIIERASPNSQNPAEFYTSEFVAPV